MAGTDAADAAALRRVMNEIVGSRVSKARLAQDGRIAPIAALLVAPALSHEVRLLAANILGSVAQHAAPATLLALLRCDIPFLLLICLGELAAKVRNAPRAPEPQPTLAKLLEAVLRALRAVMCSVSDQIGHSPRWGIGSQRGVASMSGLEHVSSRNSRVAANRPSAHSMRHDTSWNAAGPSATDVRLAIAAVWLPDTPVAAWVSRHTDESHERGAKSAKTHGADLNTLQAPSQSADQSEYLAVCASLDEAEALENFDAGAALNWLCRSAVSTVFDTQCLHHLLGMLVLATSVVDDDAEHAPAPSTPEHAPPLLGRSQALSIVESISELLGACLAVSGIEDYPSTTETSRLHLARTSLVSPPTATPTNELERRCTALLRFSAWDSKFVAPAGAPLRISNEPACTAISALLGAAESAGARVQETVLWLLHETLAACGATRLSTLLAARSPRGTPFVAVVQTLAKHRTLRVRLLACSGLVELLGTDAAPVSGEWLLQSIVGMLDVRDAVQVQACFALARLVRDRQELQALAVERYGVCEQLGKLLQGTQPQLAAAAERDASGRAAADELTVRLHEGCLTVLAALAMQSDTVRRRVVECAPAFLGTILLPSLSSYAVGVQIAACRLVRLLSRTIGILRTSLFDAGVAERMLALLAEDDNELIHAEVLAAICNLLVKFSPMKQFLLEHGGVEILAQYARSAHGAVRLNALCAIKNAVWDSDSSLKERMMDLFGWDYLAEMTRSPDVSIQRQALNIVRNLMSSPFATTDCADIEMTLTRLGEERLFGAIDNAVWSLQNDAATEQAAFILANLASGSDRHRALVIDRPNLMDALCSFLKHRSHAVREAGVRCGFNLSYPESAEGDGAVRPSAVARLRAFGYDKLLQALEQDPEPNVRDRVRETLAQI